MPNYGPFNRGARGKFQPKAQSTAVATVEPVGLTEKAKPIHSTKVNLFDPNFRPFSQMHSLDPIYSNIVGAWRDRQSQGRLTYESMMKHGAVSSPFHALLHILKSQHPVFKSAVRSPSKKQQEIVDYANAQLRRLTMSRDGRQGWTQFVDGFIGQGLEFGFSLCEFSTVIEPFDGKERVQLSGLYPIPQATLDHGHIPYGEIAQINNVMSPRYACFVFDDTGQEITQIVQYGYSPTNAIRWKGDDLQYLMHFVHRGGDGNPYGESVLYSAYYHWASLYLIEQQEEGFMEVMATPYLTASYDADVPSPEFHEEIKELVDQQDPMRRLLVGRRTDFASVTASNAAYTAHVDAKKKELRQYITESMLIPHTVYGESHDQETDSRNLIQVFFKHLLPGYLQEISSVISGQMMVRLINSNWSALDSEDYPYLEFENTLDNDLRVAGPILTSIIPYLDAQRLGEFAERILPGLKAEWFPADLAGSVQATFGAVATKGVSVPPAKQPGSPDVNHDTETPSGRHDTAA